MADEFNLDVFTSHSAKDKAAVRGGAMLPSDVHLQGS
jgi:hypothetical protein